MSLQERFEAKVERLPWSGCWVWTATCNSWGYGQVRVGRKMTQAHRVSWGLRFGPIPDGSLVLHRCDVPCCVNPEHLFLGTPQDNVLDMRRKLRDNGADKINSAKVACPRGHPYDEANTHMRSRGSRECRACNRERARRFYAAKN